MGFNAIARAAISRENEIDCLAFDEWGHDYKLRESSVLLDDARREVREGRDALWKVMRNFPCDELDALLFAMATAERQLFEASMYAEDDE